MESAYIKFPKKALLCWKTGAPKCPMRINIRKDRNLITASDVLKFINTRAKANITTLTTEDNLDK